MILSSDFGACLAVYHENTAKYIPSVLYHASVPRHTWCTACNVSRLTYGACRHSA